MRKAVKVRFSTLSNLTLVYQVVADFHTDIDTKIRNFISTCFEMQRACPNMKVNHVALEKEFTTKW